MLVALVGNQNCGKTTLFNALTGSSQRVGNFPGVTVSSKSGFIKGAKEKIEVVDLPGIYSLSPYSNEEVVTRDFILKNDPDLILNIIDATNIERNLYLTMQLMELGKPMLIAANMMDELRKAGNSIDQNKLEEGLGIEICSISASKGEGIGELVEHIKRIGSEHNVPKKLDFCPPDSPVHNAIHATMHLLSDHADRYHLPIRYLATRLIEGDAPLEDQAGLTDNEKDMIGHIVKEMEKDSGLDREAAIASMRYQFIDSLCATCVHRVNQMTNSQIRSNKIDRILTNKWLAFPIFILIMGAVFALTFGVVNTYVSDYLGLGIDYLVKIIRKAMNGASVNPVVVSMVCDGVIGGIGSVVSFVPTIVALFFFLSLLEDSGYMARVAFIMDKPLRKLGLSGRSFVPMLIGFGCSVPAVMATRTMESEKDRKITTILCGFMPCGAKLPIFALIVSTLFADSNQTAVTYSLYIFSIVVAIIVSLLLNKFVYKDETSNFIMELPQYRIPTVKTIAMHGWEKVKAYAQKAGTVIFVSTILIWFLSNFNIDSFNGNNAAANEDGSIMCEMDDSFMAGLGNVLAPIFKPQGFGEWRPAAAIVTGWIAKENVVVTFAQLYDEDVSPEYLEGYFSQYSPEELEELGFEGGTYDPEAAPDIYSESILFEGGDENALPTLHEDIATKSAAYAYMVFNLLCMPCFAAVGAMKRELKTWKELGKAVGVQMLTAYVVSLLVNVIGGLFMN